MSNATDIEERMRQGFADLLETLRAETVPDYRKVIRANTEERERQQKRVEAEYTEAGLAPTSTLALSLTAIKDMEQRGLLNTRATAAHQPTDAYEEAGE